MKSPRKRRLPFHDECGKQPLCEDLVDRFNSYLACPMCCKDLAENPPIPAQPHSAFSRNQGGRAPPGTVRRYWSCRIASSPSLRIVSCKTFSVTEMLGLCFTQLTVDQFGRSVQEITTLYDVHAPENAGLRTWVVKHRQRLDQPLSPPPATPIHVKPAKIDLWNADDTPPPKRKAGGPTGETPTRADRHAQRNQQAKDVFVDSPFSPRSPPLRTPFDPTFLTLITQAANIEADISRCLDQLAAHHNQLTPILRAMRSHAPSSPSTRHTPAATTTTTTSGTTSPTLPNSPPPPSSTTTSSTVAFTPPGKGSNRKPVEITWIYAGCLLAEPDNMSPREMHDRIMQEAAKVYGAEDLRCIIWARQLDDDDWTVELTVYKADVDRLYDAWGVKCQVDDSVCLNLHDSLRDLHNPRYWRDFLAATPNPDAIPDPTIIRRHDVQRLAQAWVGCGSRLVKTYLRRLTEEWQEKERFYLEVGIAQKASQHGTQLPDPS
jgi:hypothetical protein